LSSRCGIADPDSKGVFVPKKPRADRWDVKVWKLKGGLFKHWRFAVDAARSASDYVLAEQL